MNLSLEGRVIFFATGNLHKFNEARKVLAEFNIAVGMLRVKSLEIQSNSLQEIAEASSMDAFRKCHLPIIVEDAGLFIEALNGFPGPYAAYVYRTVGNEGLLRIMQGIESRRARFESVVAYRSVRQRSPLCFKGEVVGEITKAERQGDRESGFGFDPVFKPLTGRGTFAEMTIAEKNAFSHRAMALRRFAEWYRSLGESRNVGSRNDEIAVGKR
jgi:XTP/dITP diphosphohydrolase